MRRFYKPSLWIPQHFLRTNLDLHHGLLAMSFLQPQGSFTFPCALTEKYRPKLLSEFVGLERQRTILTNYA
jgi:hypothetical protein